MKVFFILTLLIAATLLTNAIIPSEGLHASISANQKTLQLNEIQTIPITVTNLENAATYEIQLTSQDTFSVTSNRQFLEMQSHEVKQFQLYIKSSTPGTAPLTIALLSNNTIVTQQTLNLQTSHKHDTQIYFPTEITNNCNTLLIKGYAQNTGTATEQITIKLNDQTTQVIAPPQQTTPFTLTLQNIKQLELKPLITINGKTTTQTIKITPCTNTNHKYTVTITNNLQKPMTGLFATITGLPTNWQVLTRSPTDLQPGQTTTFDVIVKPTNDNTEDIYPTLQITDSKGSEIYKKQLPTIPSTSPLTAQFTKTISKLPNWIQLLFAIFLLFVFVKLTFKNKPVTYEDKPKTIVTTSESHDSHNTHNSHETHDEHH